MLAGENAAYLDAKYRAWLEDPTSVSSDWAQLFEGLEAPTNGGALPGSGPSFTPRSIFAARASASTEAVSADGIEAKVAQLINAYRVRGHMESDIDPLERRERKRHPELSLGWYGLTEADLDRVVPTAPLYGVPERMTLRQVVAHCRKVYSGSIAAEFMNVMDAEQKQWLLEWLETLPNRLVLSREEELRVLRKLTDAENFEQMLHTRFPGTKRFSIEGGETLVPLLDLVVMEAGRQGVEEIVFGTSHRGRLNVLVNILEKPARKIVSEFQDSWGETQGSGDVKYHLGYAADTTTLHGDNVHLSLTPNPSHLEAVDPVVQGRVRAKQERRNDREANKVMAVCTHGDAAFSGQGLVMETLNLSELKGYRTGGTIHVIVNNQIGFTTPPNEGRSTPYCTDIARMLAVPILHVNGEDPRAVAAAVKLAVAWRQRFHRDVIIDMYCYRLHGHNEGDEPSFTQPTMYNAIRGRKTPRQNYADTLVRIGFLEESDVQAVFEESKAAIAKAASETDEAKIGPGTGLRTYDEDHVLHALWKDHIGGELREDANTGTDRKALGELLDRLQVFPDGFTPHRKITRLFAQRQAVARGERPVDWAMAEQAAFGTLLAAGHPVRLSGQDSGRGTFSHRHAVVTDSKNGDEYFPLAHLGARFHAIDSSLSEAGVLGFEYGYSFETPEGLVLWEAQFGDFVNGAQIIIDQFVTAGEQKWGALSGLVMLLPHGYEGQGPEHSSARPERFLLACGEDNIQVGNFTTPANLFHGLRRQVLRKARKPLVLMTPKSLLRHAEATSTLEDLAEGSFQHVYGETDASVKDGKVRRVVLCTGKIYYELRAQRRERDIHDIAIVRVEMLHPWPADQIAAQLDRYPGAEIVWCQEEPRNMGVWPVVPHFWSEALPDRPMPRYVGRVAAASPATGSHKVHVEQQRALVDESLTLDTP